MFEGLKRAVLGVLRVPPEPDPPAGAPRSLARFRAAPNYLRYQLALWAAKQFLTLAGLLVGFGFLLTADLPDVPGWRLVEFLEILGVALFLFQALASLVVVLLDYEQRWYLVTDRSLRIREGVLRVQEKTQSFANIQNLSIRQGPLQRLLGIADLEVRTAGGGDGAASAHGAGEASAHESLHKAYFRGVANAEQVRDVILARLRKLRDAGLGDPEDPDEEPAGEPHAGVESLLEAMEELRRAARDLRRGPAS